jgi:hypothetical protein
MSTAEERQAELRERLREIRDRPRRAAADVEGEATPPPPTWFTLIAAAVPAIPFSVWVSYQVLLYWLPVWVVTFYALPRKVLRLSPTLLVSMFATHGSLVEARWAGWSLWVATALLGFLMDLIESALWDSLEPYIIGQKGFGAGSRRRVDQGAGGERVTAASSIRGGDPARAAAASAFTQAELDALSRGIKPWDPQANAALKKLEGG